MTISANSTSFRGHQFRGETGDSMTELESPGGEFLRRVRSAAVHVLGDSPAGREVLELCDSHAEARQMVLQDRSHGSTVIAVIGATGQGKSWLIQQFTRGSSAAAAIRSGNNASDATEKLFWVGPMPPADLDTRHEQYVHCSATEMQSMGGPYLLVDAPGSTDDRRAIAATAARALSLASVLLLVVRRDQLRSENVAMLSTAGEGSIVIPIVNAVRTRDDALQNDVEAFGARIRKAAPTSKISVPVLIDDFEMQSRSEPEVGKVAVQTIADRLQAELGDAWEGDRRRGARLAALDSRFRGALHSVLSDQLPELTVAVRRLNQEATRLPLEVAESLVGSGSSLRAAVRSRLRVALLSETAAFWFPYRSQLALLNLTHGAWDRVLMSLSGSLPSLVTTVWTSTKNLMADSGAQADIREGLQRRSAAAVADRLGPLAMRFRSELAQLGKGGVLPPMVTSDGSSRSQVAYLAGIDTLQESSQRIFDQEVDRVSISRFHAMLFAAVGTLIFWFLMAGPIVALYRGYFDASYTTLRDFAGNLDSFPRPDLAMMLTSLLLSLLPTALFSMIVLSIAQSRSRVDAAESRIRQLHHETIEQLQRQGVLRLRWDEPLLADAEFLLSAGAGEADSNQDIR